MAADLRDHEQKKEAIFREPTDTTAGYAICVHLSVNMSPEYPADHHCQISEL